MKLMKFLYNLSFIDIDFCKPKVIRGLDLNFKLFINSFKRCIGILQPINLI